MAPSLALDDVAFDARARARWCDMPVRALDDDDDAFETDVFGFLTSSSSIERRYCSSCRKTKDVAGEFDGARKTCRACLRVRTQSAKRRRFEARVAKAVAEALAASDAGDA